ncbi:MAG TPA: hypothetical protein VJ837_03045, partial [Candidatus Paceibacterota bacterium]|nr:hypothetical protein [Candidatus Paceibacterota bacterium]
ERARDKRVAAELRKEKEDDPDGSKRLERARQDARGRGIREAFGEALELQRQEEERARRKTEEFWESPEGRRITAERKEEADRRAQEREDREQEGYTQRAEALRREKAPEERQRELIAERLPVDPDRFDDLIDELERRGAVVGEDLPYDRFKDQMRTVRARAEHALKYPTAEHKKALDETAERVRSKVHELARKYGVDLNHYNGPSEGQLEEAA